MSHMESPQSVNVRSFLPPSFLFAPSHKEKCTQLRTFLACIYVEVRLPNLQPPIFRWEDDHRMPWRCKKGLVAYWRSTSGDTLTRRYDAWCTKAVAERGWVITSEDECGDGVFRLLGETIRLTRSNGARSTRVWVIVRDHYEVMELQVSHSSLAPCRGAPDHALALASGSRLRKIPAAVATVWREFPLNFSVPPVFLLSLRAVPRHASPLGIKMVSQLQSHLAGIYECMSPRSISATSSHDPCSHTVVVTHRLIAHVVTQPDLQWVAGQCEREFVVNGTSWLVVTIVGLTNGNDRPEVPGLGSIWSNSGAVSELARRRRNPIIMGTPRCHEAVIQDGGEVGVAYGGVWDWGGASHAHTPQVHFILLTWIPHFQWLQIRSTHQIDSLYELDHPVLRALQHEHEWLFTPKNGRCRVLHLRGRLGRPCDQIKRQLLAQAEATNNVLWMKLGGCCKDDGATRAGNLYMTRMIGKLKGTPPVAVAAVEFNESETALTSARIGRISDTVND
ncbi:hypothetical protein BJY52DRAFT_1420243 [Lactarius psammicola]|nr:hypothetical protein BJY52DRAFT_1420243 [Lactarius psammicola]